VFVRNTYQLAIPSHIRSAPFHRTEVSTLVEALDLPDVVECPQSGIKEDRVTALCMLLCHLAYPNRPVELEMQFGWKASRTSRITRCTSALLWQRWKHLL
jgi:hypothetical protein